MPDSFTERAAAMAVQLRHAHAVLRDDLAAARAGLAGGALRPELRQHCIAFCDALHNHHDRESGVGFPQLEARFPELRPALQRLRAEHATLARTLAEMHGLLAAADRTQVRSRFDELAADLEAHFAYEEEQLLPTLDALTTRSRAAPSGPRPSGA